MTKNDSTTQTNEPTAPVDFLIHIVGFDFISNTEILSVVIRNYINQLSENINCSRLDGVTIAWDYGEALKALDRGISGLQPLEFTIIDDYRGVAMSPQVLRNGTVKAHIVLSSDIAISLIQTENEELIKKSIYTLAHELCHVQDTLIEDLAFPNLILNKKYFTSMYDSHLFSMAEGCWSEYIATRLSALYFPGMVAIFEQNLLNLTLKIKKNTDFEIKKYRYHGNIVDLFDKACSNYRSLLCGAAYYLGHMHGLGMSLENVSKQIRDKVLYSYFDEVFIMLDSALQKLYDTYYEWNDIKVFEKLKSIVWSCLEIGGLVLEPKDDGNFSIHVPFRLNNI